MKKISVLFLLIVMMVTTVIGCTQKQEDPLGTKKPVGNESPVGEKKEEPSLVDAYMAVIDNLYEEDPGLNGGIKYIAIDTSKMVNLTDEGKTELLKRLADYGFEVLNMTFEELKEKGYVKDLFFSEGILFQIEDEPTKSNSIKMDASKWRSGLGAIGYDDLIIKYKDAKWEITKFGSMWIS